MADTPFKIRFRRVRENVVVDLQVPLGRGRYSTVESVNLGPGSISAAIAGLSGADFAAAPRLRAALVPTIT